MGVAPGTVSGEAMDALNARIDSIADSLDALARADTLTDDQARFAVAELDERLAAIDQQVQAANLLAERSAEAVVRSVDDRMTEIARRIDENERAHQSVPSIAQLDQRLDQIAAMLASGGSSSAPVDIAHLEAQIADLSEALAQGGPGPVDEERIWTAARTAAEEVASRMGAAGGDTAMPETLDKLTGDLRTLEALARETDTRNTETFGAIHDTLLQVVDHLASLEDKVRSAPQPAMPAAAPMAPASPMHIDDAPPLETVVDTTDPADHVMDGPVSPAQAAIDAARFAFEDRSEPAMTEPPAGGRASFLKSVTDRLPIGRGRKAPTPAAEQKADPYAVPVDDLAPVVEDQPIEPGTDQMALADIMARVRAERKGNAPTEPDDDRLQAPGADTGKSDFIAAARRAAQAAAADAGMMSGGPAAADSNGRGSIVGAVSRRRKPIMMAAGAILLAILALPLVRGFIAPGPEAVVAEAPEPPAIVETLPDEDISAQAPETTAPEAAPSRDVLAEADATQAAPGAEPDVAGTPAPDLAAVAPDPAEATDEEGVETATATSFDDLPENVGSVALREAAASGDAMALHVIGDRLADAARGGNGDLSEALKWYERAAELGFAPAQYRTGNFYEKGFGAERDFATAKTWYQLAAEQGNASAMHNLAVLFASGADGPPDFDSAARWFLRAAELGVRDSQFNLGILAAKGQGVPQDLGESYKWFALAAQSGDDDAAAKRDDIANVLRPDQLETARGATALWRAKPVDEAANMVDVPEAWQTGDTVTAAAAPISEEDMRRAVANIQAILNDNGYDAGPVDGLMGQKTRDAIIAFQRDNGLPATGNVDQGLVESLLALAQTEG
ncbi:MAG: peptidoglycan-binding protein [Phyllobacteriaceae bacterium]|nr:peptidoglycan-binding protein [Phyllobacteriaceae bacterium]